MATIEKQKVSVGEDVDGSEPHPLLGGIWNGAATWKTVWRFLPKLNIDLPCDPAILLLRIRPKGLKSGSRRDVCSPVCPAGYLTVHRQMNDKRIPPVLFLLLFSI